MNKKLPVVEIFQTIQGEGALAGYKTSFIRLGYCTYRCKWCDTMYAVDPKFKDKWEQLNSEEIAQRVRGIPASWVTITGGNPAIHDLTRLIGLLHALKKRVNIETQGDIPRNWFAACNMTTLSPKPPSSGMTTNWDKLDVCVSLSRRPVLKVVVDTAEDYHYARQVFHRYPQVSETYLQSCTHPGDALEDIVSRWRVLTDTVLHDSGFLQVAVLPQLHVLLWGHRRGV